MLFYKGELTYAETSACTLLNIKIADSIELTKLHFCNFDNDDFTVGFNSPILNPTQFFFTELTESNFEDFKQKLIAHGVTDYLAIYDTLDIQDIFDVSPVLKEVNLPVYPESLNEFNK